MGFAAAPMISAVRCCQRHYRKRGKPKRLNLQSAGIQVTAKSQRREGSGRGKPNRGRYPARDKSRTGVINLVQEMVFAP